MSDPYSEGYDYSINYEEICNNESEQKNETIQKVYDGRKIKMKFINYVWTSILIIMMYIIWRFTKNVSKDKLFFGMGCILLCCYLLRDLLFFAFFGVSLIQLSVADEVPLGCLRTGNNKIDCNVQK